MGLAYNANSTVLGFIEHVAPKAKRSKDDDKNANKLFRADERWYRDPDAQAVLAAGAWLDKLVLRQLEAAFSTLPFLWLDLWWQRGSKGLAELAKNAEPFLAGRKAVFGARTMSILPPRGGSAFDLLLWGVLSPRVVEFLTGHSAKQVDSKDMPLIRSILRATMLGEPVPKVEQEIGRMFVDALVLFTTPQTLRFSGISLISAKTPTKSCHVLLAQICAVEASRDGCKGCR